LILLKNPPLSENVIEHVKIVRKIAL